MKRTIGPITLLVVLIAAAVIVRSDGGEIRLPSDDGEPCAAATENGRSSCPVKCFRADPVCGVDGVTYWCGCEDARCAGAKVAKLGFCQVGNGGAAPLSAQALLLLHIVWLIVLGFSLLFGLF